MAETRFTSLLKARVKEEVGNRLASLANGDASDYARYQNSVGYIQGLNAAIKICEDIEGEYDQ